MVIAQPLRSQHWWRYECAQEVQCHPVSVPVTMAAVTGAIMGVRTTTMRTTTARMPPEFARRSMPTALRRVFAHLEHIGRSVQEALGCGQLLTPRLGMVATYDDSRHGYVCHMDNERYTADGQASGFRNYRVLTVIAYLNDDVWCESDGGHLRCFAPQRGEGADAANWVPTTESQAAGQGSCELEVLPTGGTVVVFPSCLVPHEVRPARRARTAAYGLFRATCYGQMWPVRTLMWTGAARTPRPQAQTAARQGWNKVR